MRTEAENTGSNLERFYLELATLGGYEEGGSDNVLYAWNRKGSWPAHLIGTPDARSIPHLTRSMREGKLPPFLIAEDTPLLDTHALEEQGVRTVRQWTGMVLDPAGQRPVPCPPGLRIISDDPETWMDWQHLVNTELLTSSSLDMHLASALCHAPSFNMLTAYEEEEAVGAGLLYTTDKISGIYLVATRKDKRKRGIGGSLCAALVDQARNRGSALVVLHATDMARNMYKRLGFRPVNRYLVMWCLGVPGHRTPEAD